MIFPPGLVDIKGCRGELKDKATSSPDNPKPPTKVTTRGPGTLKMLMNATVDAPVVTIPVGHVKATEHADGL